MNRRRIARIAVVVCIALSADLAFAAKKQPSWAEDIDVGSAVRVTMKTGVAFDGFWMGLDRERAVFERLDPHETVSVRVEAIRRVKTRSGQAAASVGRMGALGAVAGFFGALAVMAMLLSGGH